MFSEVFSVNVVKRFVWPIFVGAIAVEVFFFVMNVAYDLLTVLSSVPVIRFCLLLNKSLLGVDIITADSFVIGSIVALMFMNLLTLYDKEDGRCYKRASRTCGIGCLLYTISAFYILITSDALTFAAFSNMVPYIIFDVVLFAGSKFK